MRNEIKLQQLMTEKAATQTLNDISTIIDKLQEILLLPLMCSCQQISCGNSRKTTTLSKYLSVVS